ncbi:MAG: hypothetical protein Q9222_003825 [Ikaeria aurantiellina]
MATASPITSCDARRDNGLTEAGTPRLKTGLDDKRRDLGLVVHHAIWRCGSVCMEQTPACAFPTPVSTCPLLSASPNKYGIVKTAELLDFAEHPEGLDIEPPPPYSDSIADAPPRYYTLQLVQPDEDSANQSFQPSKSNDYFKPQWHAERYVQTPPIHFMTPPAIDFNDTSSFRQVPSKKKKQQQKQADQAKWADDGDEGANEGGEGGENAGGGGGGGSNNGDGGGGDDGWGGDDWNTGGGGKKKKGKKGKNAVDEEEEKKKKEEEEEKKRKDEEGADGADPLAWMIDEEVKPDDEWGAFASTDKKGKKNKKGKADTATAPPTNNGFSDINLDDTPKIDMSFGNDFGTKDSGSGFGSFGSWGGGWGSGAMKDLGGAGGADIAESNNASGGDAGIWSFGGSKKNKKTTTTSGFDFGNFDTLDSIGEDQSTAVAAEQDDWATSAFGKKSKKKNILDDSLDTNASTTIGTAVTEPTTANDSWGTWGTSASKKDKNKKKKNEPDLPGEDIPPVPPPPPPAPIEPPVEDTWSAFGTKNKKKSKKGAVEEPVVAVPDPEPEADLGWGSFTTGKDKKKGKKDAVSSKKTEDPSIEVVADPDPEPEPDLGWGFSSKKDGKDKKKGKKGAEAAVDHEPAVVVVPEPEAAADLGWGDFGATKKDKKKGKKGVAEEEKVSEPVATAVTDAESAIDFGWGAAGGKKEKKKSKKTVEDDQPKDDDIVAVVTDPDPDPIVDAGWGSFGAKKDSKKAKKVVPDEADVAQIPGIDPITEDTFSAAWGITAKKGKKDKKGTSTTVKEDPIAVADPVAVTEAANNVGDDDWMNWGSDKKKDKKGKKGVVEAKKEEFLPPPPPPPPAVPDFPEAPSTDIWGTSKKDKKGKKGKTVEPEPPIVEVPDPPTVTKVEKEDDDWGSFGLTASEKKKREKAKLKEREKEEKEQKEKEELQRKEQEELEKKEKEEKEKEKVKPGKKGKAGTTGAATSKFKDLMADSFPDPPPPPAPPVVEEDTWGSSIWGSSKRDSKKKPGKKESIFEVPPPVPTPPTQGLTPPLESNLDDLIDDDWGFTQTETISKSDPKKPSKTDPAKASKSASKDKTTTEKAKPAEESAAKAARSFWGGMTSSTPASKSKTSKEKDSVKPKNGFDFDPEEDLDEIVDIIEEEPEPPPKKGSKTKTGDSKTAKAGIKDDKAGKNSASDKKTKADAEMDALIDFDDLEPKNSKNKPADTAKGKSEDNKADAWSFWGSSKKPTGKKGDEPKKEINKQQPANQNDPLAWISNEPEPPPFADQVDQFPSSNPSKTAMSTSKTSGKLSVSQKVKALEEEKRKALEPPAPPPIAEIEKVEPPAKKSSASGKTKAATANKSAFSSRKKDPSPPPAAESKKKTSDESVPGSFPAEGNDEENLLDMLASSPAEKKSTKKGSRPVKSAAKQPNKDVMDFDMPAVPAAPPTPPAEPTPAKSAKKERPRVVRDEGGSSWGFWGAAPKKDAKKTSKAKDDTDMPPAKKATAPALARSKSTKTTKEKEKDTEKSSGSDGKEKKAESRPSKSRGSSFGALFGGPPPVRAKTVRRTSTSAASKTTSRRQSMDVDAYGLPSPPPEESPAMGGKAGKVMGASSSKSNRNVSTKGKQKASAVPDPYPIDDDDMVMVNGIEDPVINAPVPKSSKKSAKDKGSKSKPKQDIKSDFEAGDDVVMVEGPSQEEPELLAFDEKPRARAPLQRSATSAKKPKNGNFMGLFGGFAKTRRNSETGDRPKSKAVITDDEALSPRKRTVHSREDSSKRIRRDDRKVRRSEKTDRDTEGFITDALNEGGAEMDIDAAEDVRKERRGKREARETEARTSKDRSSRPTDAGKAGEDSRRTKDSERRTKRAGKDERPERVEEEPRKHTSSRPHKSDRRRSYMESPQTSERPKAHRSRTDKASSKRHSIVANGLVEDYFDPRNGVADGKNEPYMHGANDHTSSWVKSQLSDPADPPPVEGTVIEPKPELGGKGGYEKDDEDARKARKARRQSRYGPDGDSGDADRERRRRRREKESEGSTEWGGRDREKLSRRYTDAGMVRGAVDGRPSLGAAGKRGSWLKKVTGLGV